MQVEYTEEQGSLYYFKYPVADSATNEYLPVATTRPETILGDTAVAVNPSDTRYQHLVGKHVVVPIVNRWVGCFGVGGVLLGGWGCIAVDVGVGVGMWLSHQSKMQYIDIIHTQAHPNHC